MDKRTRSRRHKDPPAAPVEAKDQSGTASKLEEPRGEQMVAPVNDRDVRPAPDDRCAECGHRVADSWVSYRSDPANPENLIRHFGGIVNAGPAEPPVDQPKPRTTDFRYPDDLGVFFHSWCAPRIQLPEKLQEELTEIMAEALVAHVRETEERWATIRLPTPAGPPTRCHAQVASVEGRRVFTMARAEWERFRPHEGQLIEIELERTPPGGLAESASAIAALAAQCHVQTERLEVWRYAEQDRPGFHNLQDYLVLQNFTRQIHLPKFAERVSTHDTPRLRKLLREHVFLVKERSDKGRWEPKARALERVVFLST
jgi:hypothetical protein